MRRAVVYLVMLGLLGLLGMLNYVLWKTEHNQRQRIQGLRMQVAHHQSENRQLQERNNALVVDVDNLRSPQAYFVYEEKARENYGLIGQNETFFVLPKKEWAHLPDVPGIARDGNRVLAASPTIPVSPIPLQLESLK